MFTKVYRFDKRNVSHIETSDVTYCICNISRPLGILSHVHVASDIRLSFLLISARARRLPQSTSHIATWWATSEAPHANNSVYHPDERDPHSPPVLLTTIYREHNSCRGI